MRATPRARRVSGDSGSIVVETAIVFPFLFLLVMGLLEFSLFELRQSQLSSAARDGARAGIITWFAADTGVYTGGTCPSTPTSFANICDSVVKRLAGSKAASIRVACYVGTSATVESCADGTVTEGLDTMRVTVTYTYKPVSFVGQAALDPNKIYNYSARMVIQ